MTEFKEGDPVQVVGYLCTNRTCIGLFGFVERIWTPEEMGRPDRAPLYVALLQDPDLEDPSARAKEERAKHRFDWDTWTCSAYHKDLIPLTDPVALARVARYKEAVAAYWDEPRDPVVDKIMDDAIRNDHKERDKLVEARAAELWPQFRLPGGIERGDKSGYPAYRDPAVYLRSQEVQGYACRQGPRGEDLWTIEERARWKLCLEAVEQASFFSPMEEVRRLVHELDLDPMADNFNKTLYRGFGSVYAPKGQLRNKVIPVWNKGAVVLDITEMQDEETCWSDYHGKEPNGFLVYYAFRRTLPEP